MFTEHSTRTTVAALAICVMIVGFVACQARAVEGHVGHNHLAAGDDHADHQHSHIGCSDGSLRACATISYRI